MSFEGICQFFCWHVCRYTVHYLNFKCVAFCNLSQKNILLLERTCDLDKKIGKILYIFSYNSKDMHYSFDLEKGRI